MRIVQVGLGGFGRNWAEAMIPQVTEVELVGSADVSEESRKAAIAAGVADPDRCYATTEEAIEVCDPDAVLVTASLVGHVPAVRAALEAGKHVMVEKPFAPTVAEGRELVELAESKDLVLAVSQNYRFFPAVRAVKKLVAEGVLGELHAIEIDFRRFSGTNGNRGPHHYLDEPLLVDMSIHHFDLMRTLLGRNATEVTCRTWDPEWSLFAGPSEGAALIDFGGTMVSYRGSWVSHGSPTPWAGLWRMDFADGELAWTSRGDGKDGWKSDEVFLRRDGQEPEQVELPVVERTDRAGSLTEFARAIAEGRQPENSGLDNLGTLQLTYATVESALGATTVTLP
jgi:predicted dehydrogenase